MNLSALLSSPGSSIEGSPKLTRKIDGDDAIQGLLREADLSFDGTNLFNQEDERVPLMPLQLTSNDWQHHMDLKDLEHGLKTVDYMPEVYKRIGSGDKPISRTFACQQHSGCVKKKGRKLKIVQRPAGFKMLISGVHVGTENDLSKKRGLPKDFLEEIDNLLDLHKGQPKYVQNQLILKYWDGEATTKETFKLYQKIRSRARTKKSHKTRRFAKKKVSP